MCFLYVLKSVRQNDIQSGIKGVFDSSDSLVAF